MPASHKARLHALTAHAELRPCVGRGGSVSKRHQDFLGRWGVGGGKGGGINQQKTVPMSGGFRWKFNFMYSKGYRIDPMQRMIAIGKVCMSDE